MSLRNFSPTVKNTLIIIGFILIFICAYYLSDVVAPFLISLVVAYIINPIITKLVEKKIPRAWAVLAVFFACVMFFVVFIVPFTISIVSEAGEILNKLGNLDVNKLAENYKIFGARFYEKLSQLPYVKPYLDEFVHGNEIRELMAQGFVFAKDNTVSFFKYIMNFLVGAFAGMVNMFLIPILVFYILLDIDEILTGFKMLLPPDYKERVLKITGEIDIQLSSMLRGQLISNSIFATLMTIGIWMSGLNFALFLGLLAGLANFIPYLGGLFTASFALFVAVAQFGLSAELFYVVIKLVCVIALVQIVDSCYSQPYIVGENVGLHPLIVMLALAVAGSIGGVTGMLLAVPVTVILKVLGREFYHELYDRSVI